MTPIPAFAPVSYALHRHLAETTVAAALPRVRAALATQGFGVLTEIDLQATLQAKLGVKERDFVILGACNPPLAQAALSAEPGVGLLLPCNVVVSADDDGGVDVSTIDPIALFALVGRPEVEPLAQQVRARLQAALAAL